MSLQLSGQSERPIEPHKEFYGQMHRQMPRLITGKDVEGNIVDVPRKPASFTYVIDRRMSAPEDVREAWQRNYFFTADGSATRKKGDHLIVLNSQDLLGLNPNSELYCGALVLKGRNAWSKLKSQKDNVLYLTADEANEVHSEGWIKKNGVWQPANKTVGKVWDFLTQGRNLNDYVQMVEAHSPHSNSLLNVYLNDTVADGKATMRPWVASRTNNDSNSICANFIDYNYARLVGLSDGVAQLSAEGATRDVVKPRLEDILAIVSDSDLSQNDKIRQISDKYQI